MTGERGIFKWDGKKFVKVRKLEVVQKPKGIITDEIEPTQSPASFHKEVFTSKSKLRKHYRDNGFVETGGDHLNVRERAKTQEDREREAREDKEIVEQAFMDVKYQRIPFTEKEKQNHLEEKWKWGHHYKVKSPV